MAAGQHAGVDLPEDKPNDAELLASLGGEAPAEDDISQLVHVRSREEINAAEEIAQRNPCNDFEEFRPIFDRVQRALYKDQASRRITEPGYGLLFSDDEDDGDLATGYIYVLRSKSEHPFVAEHRSVLHKIGVTGGDVKSRVANAKKDPTYLLADVEIVTTYKLANVNRAKLEALLQKFFGSARLDLQLKDRFGSHVEPREWFLVPLPAIDEASKRIKDGTIGDFRYDVETALLIVAS